MLLRLITLTSLSDASGPLGMGKQCIHSVNEASRLFYWYAFQPLGPLGCLLKCLKRNRWSVIPQGYWMREGALLTRRLLQCSSVAPSWFWPLSLLMFEKNILSHLLVSILGFFHPLSTLYPCPHISRTYIIISSALLNMVKCLANALGIQTPRSLSQ